MVTLSHLINSAYPAARIGMGGSVAITSDGTGQRITHWDAAKLGPEPHWDAATGTYPALEQHRAAAEAAAALAARQWPALDFLKRFTQEERIAIAQAARTDAIIADFRMLCSAAGIVHAGDPLTIQGMGYLVTQGLLSTARAAAILGESL